MTVDPYVRHYAQHPNAHAYDYLAIPKCVCGSTLGYRRARLPEPYRCTQCNREPEASPRTSPALPANAQAFVDAADNAIARAVPEVTGAAMHVPMALWTAMLEARAAMREQR
ncbi:MAG TPA: hypothetical protein VHM19_23070 [Polyangiales bacterium]|jgi:hypothetical protein|nr:hypothetical protein [Polyangiales bacterium]